MSMQLDSAGTVSRGSVRDENNVLQLAPAVTLVEQLRMLCGVCKSNDLNDTLLTGMLNAARLS